MRNRLSARTAANWVFDLLLTLLARLPTETTVLLTTTLGSWFGS